jgi:hypothetical protein
MSIKNNEKKLKFLFIIVAAVIVISLCLVIFSCNQKQTTNMIIQHEENNSNPSIDVQGDVIYHNITIYDGDGNIVANYKGKYNALRNGEILTLTDDISSDIITISLGENYTIVDIAGSANDTIATVS